MDEQQARELERRIRESFASQGLMRTLGAEIVSFAPGEVEISFPWRPEVSQQHGYAHAGAVIACVDTACGFAAASAAARPAEVLTVELKVNLLAPAAAPTIRAVGRVVRSGRTLTVCSGDAYAVGEDGETHVATVLATMMFLEPRS